MKRLLTILFNFLPFVLLAQLTCCSPSKLVVTPGGGGLVVPPVALYITQQAAPQTVYQGSTVTLNALASGGSGAISVTWYKAGTAIVGNTFTATSTTTVYPVFRDALNVTVQGITVTITVVPTITISSVPTIELNSGQAATITATSTGGTGSTVIKFYKNGSLVHIGSPWVYTGVYADSSQIYYATATDISAHVATSPSSEIIVHDTTHVYNNTYRVTMPFAGTVSTGLYSLTGDTLINQEYQNLAHNAGNFDSAVTGYTELGAKIPDGTYWRKTLVSHTVYRQKGGYMNSSRMTNGYSHWRGGPDGMSCMTITGNTAFVGNGYAEDAYAAYAFKLDSIQDKIVFTGKTSYTNTAQICTDDSLVFFAETGINLNSRVYNYVYAVRVSNTGFVDFDSGITVDAYAQLHRESVIDTASDDYFGNSFIHQLSGIAVQPHATGNYLFTSRVSGMKILNKATGKLIKNIPVYDASYLKVDRTGQYLWAVEGNQIKKYIIGVDTITYTGTYASINSSIGIDVSYDNNTLASVDPTRQQVFFFNTSNGSFNRTLGEYNAYFDGSSLVNNKRFMFRDGRGVNLGFVCFQPDGNYWVSDRGNSRYMKFSSIDTFIDRIAYLGRNYSVFKDPNDTTALFAKGSYLVRIDPNGYAPVSWSLTNNWAASIGTDADENLLNQPITIQGHRFSTIRYGNDNQFVEISDTGVRFIPLHFSDLGSTGLQQLDSNLDLLNSTGVGPFYRLRKKFLGLDGSNNPTYASSWITEGNPPMNTQAPQINSTNITAQTAGSYVHLDGHGQNGSGGHSTGYHLGKISRNGGTTFTQLAALAVPASYNGPYPRERFSNGNSVNDNAAGQVQVTSRNEIVYVANNENYNQGQAFFANIYDARLLLQKGQYGLVVPRISGENDTFQVGNVKCIVTFQKSNHHMVHVINTESWGGELMAIEDSLDEDTFIDSSLVTIKAPIKINRPYTFVLDSLSGGIIGHQGRVFNSDSTGTGLLAAHTQYYTYKPRQDVTLQASLASNYSSHPYFTMALKDTILATSSFTGSLAFPDALSNNINYHHGQSLFRIKDTAGKVVLQVEIRQTSFNNDGNNNPHYMFVNGQQLPNWVSSYEGDAYTVQGTVSPFVISQDGTNITFTYAGNTITVAPQDGTANIHALKTASIEFSSGFDAEGKQVILTDFKEYYHN